MKFKDEQKAVADRLSASVHEVLMSARSRGEFEMFRLVLGAALGAVWSMRQLPGKLRKSRLVAQHVGVEPEKRAHNRSPKNHKTRQPSTSSALKPGSRTVH